MKNIFLIAIIVHHILLVGIFILNLIAYLMVLKAGHISADFIRVFGIIVYIFISGSLFWYMYPFDKLQLFVRIFILLFIILGIYIILFNGYLIWFNKVLNILYLILLFGIFFISEIFIFKWLIKGK